MPKKIKKRPQKPSKGPFLQHNAQKKAGGGAEAQIPLADAEAHIYPPGEGKQQENKVRGGGEPGPQRPQEAVQQPQNRSHRQSAAKPGRGYGRGGHPIRRRQKPPGRGSS